MTILFQAIEVRHETRLRLVFTSPLAAGAYGVPAPSYYTITNNDGRGASPSIQAALLIPTTSTVLELSLAQPLVAGSSYTVSAIGVPAADTSVTPGGSSLPLRWGFIVEKVDVEPAVRDRQRLLYGIDLLWGGSDYQETANGDLDRVDGTANVTKALFRGVESSGLPWDPTYGAGAREFVDSPSLVAGTLKGNISAQILKDPRVKSVKITHEIDDYKTYLYANPTLISGEPIKEVSIEVPNA